MADHVEVKNGCHIWTGTLTERGYPSMTIGSMADGTRRPRRVHRVVWEAHNGSPAAGLDVHHKCENIRCVNLAHLELLPHGEHSRHHGRKGWHGGYSLHVRWHVNRGLVNPDCEFC